MKLEVNKLMENKKETCPNSGCPHVTFHTAPEWDFQAAEQCQVTWSLSHTQIRTVWSLEHVAKWVPYQLKATSWIKSRWSELNNLDEYIFGNKRINLRIN